MTAPLLIALTLALTPASVTVQDPHAQHKAGMDHRGNQAMGFDQAKIQHTFTTVERGGEIQVVAKDAKDAETVTQIRSHLREIARLFKAGDFSKPVFIHAQNPPGADTMKARRGSIDYRVEEIPSGAKLTIASDNAEAVAAIHAFLRFQQQEHKD
jgi:hypothetical protein